MIQLVEILVEVVDRVSKKSLHEFRKYAQIDVKGSYIRTRFYYPNDGEDSSLAFIARQQVLGELFARDAKAPYSPVLTIRNKIDEFPWALDSVIVNKAQFANKELLEEYYESNPHVKEGLIH